MRALSIGASLGATLVLAVGCGSSSHHSATSHTGTGAVVTPSGRHLPKLSTASMLQGVTGAASAENFAIDYDKGLLVLDPAVK